MRLSLWLLGGLVLLALPLSGCGRAMGGEIRSGMAREYDPEVTPTELRQVAAGNQDFALRLYQQLKDKPENVLFSPHSISSALAMAYAGARGETEQQMAQTLAFPFPQDKLHPAFNLLDLTLMGKAPGQTSNSGFELHIANALWGQQDEKFLPAFLDTLGRNYGAGMRTVDFAKPNAAELINHWVAAQTKDKIPAIVTPEQVRPPTTLVLTNAVYFNAEWAKKFKEDSTTPGSFILLDGKQITVDMMHGEQHGQYASGLGYQAVSILYANPDISFVILLPDRGAFREFEVALTLEKLTAILDALQDTEYQLTMPKFTFTDSFSLGDTLRAMGMPFAFQGGRADFSGINGQRDLFIAAVLHKAFIDVNEERTEAAAATAVVMKELAAPQARLRVTVDRPFIFLLREKKTGAVLFLGRVVDPRAE